MTKEEFNKAVDKLVDMRDNATVCEEISDKEFVNEFFRNLKNDPAFSKLIYMMFCCSIHGVEELKDRLLNDWDNPGYQEFLSIVDKYGALWGEFIAELQMLYSALK